MVLTGADPTLLGGGEFARDMDVEVKDALSEILSSAAEPGRCMEVMLGRREACLLVAPDGRLLGEAGWVSFLESRRVRGRLWRKADEADAGVGGWERAGVPEASPVAFLTSLEALTDSISSEVSSAAAMSSLAGLCFLSVVFDLVEEATFRSRSDDLGAVLACETGLLSRVSSLFALPFLPTCHVDWLLESAGFISVVSWSSNRESFSAAVVFADEERMFGTTGLMAALVVALR